jgi:hypothetical protein
MELIDTPGKDAPLYEMRSIVFLLAGLIFSSVAKGDGWELHAASKGDDLHSCSCLA